MLNKKILLAAQNDLRHSARMLSAIKHLHDNGYSIDLVTQNISNSELVDVEKVIVVKTWEKETYQANSHNPNRILRIATNLFYKFLNLMIGEKILPPIKTQLEKWVFLHRNEYDLLWAIDLVSLPSVIKGAKGSKVPVVYETLDLVAEYPYDKKLQRLRRSWEKKYLPKVSAVITAGNEYARYYQERYSYNSPIIVVHNYAPTISNVSFLNSDSIKFLFFGNIMFDRPVDKLFKAFSEVQGSHTLTVMGVNYLGDVPEKKIKELGLDKRVKIIPPVNPLDGSREASKYDVGIAMLDGNDLNERLAPTAKLGTYLAAGLAIVATNLPGMREELKEVQALYADAGNIDSWKQVLNQIVNLPEKEIIEMKKSSSFFAQNHPLEKELAKYSGLFDQLIGVR